jgi:hypothetical protein
VNNRKDVLLVEADRLLRDVMWEAAQHEIDGIPPPSERPPAAITEEEARQAAALAAENRRVALAWQEGRERLREALPPGLLVAFEHKGWPVEKGEVDEALAESMLLPSLPWPDKPGVYAVVGMPGYVKIGNSQHIAGRLSDIQGSCPVPLRLAAVLSTEPPDERSWHARFAEERVRGEWFALSPRLYRALLNAWRGSAAA